MRPAGADGWAEHDASNRHPIPRAPRIDRGQPEDCADPVLESGPNASATRDMKWQRIRFWETQTSKGITFRRLAARPVNAPNVRYAQS
jgi:hypothetical protein